MPLVTVIKVDSLGGLDAHRPLSPEERNDRLDDLEEVKCLMRGYSHVVVEIDTDTANCMRFDPALPPYRDDPERLLEDLAKALDIAGFGEPWQGWISINSSEVIVQNPIDLANLLKLAMKRSGLGSGQLSIKTGIHRSQIYLLTKAERGSIPRSSQQLRRFLRACRVSPETIDTVIAQWCELPRKREVDADKT